MINQKLFHQSLEGEDVIEERADEQLEKVEAVALDPKDVRVMHDYLETVCNALMFDQLAKARRVEDVLVKQFAKQNHVTALRSEVDWFARLTVEELTDTNSWYFLDENLERFMCQWIANGIMKSCA